MNAKPSAGGRDFPDLLAGVIMAGLGALGLWAGRDLTFGTPAMMGPGFLPAIICGLLCVIGVAVFAKGLVKPSQSIEQVNIKPLLILVAAIAGFAFFGERLGFVIATIWLIVVGSLADPESRWREIAWSAAILTTLGALLFIYGLGVQMPIWPL
jgi:hypothetical protein